MRIRAISDHGWQLTRFGLVNCYLVRESDGFTLIDAGVPGSAELLLDAARQVGVATEVQRILLTHAHSDHIGSLDRLAHLLGTAEVAISRRESPLLAKKPAQDRGLQAGEAPCRVKGGYPGAETRPTHLVEDGELYGSLRCLATPGHTPGHFSYLDERDGTLYGGDALVTVGGQPHVSGWARWYFPLPNLATWHRPTALASVERLVELGRQMPMRCLAVGHGPLVKLEAGTLESAVEEARRG